MDLIPWQYRPGNSPLHRLPAGFKLLCFLGLSLAALVPEPLFLLLPAGGVIAASLAAKIPPWKLLRGSRPLLLLALMVILFRGIEGGPSPALSLPGIIQGLRLGGIMLIAYAAGALLFSVTTMGEIRESLGRLESALAGSPGPGRIRVSLGIALMLGFIPRFFELWENAGLAWEARAGKGGIRRFIIILPLVTERMLKLASETAEAMENRGF